MQLCGAIRKQTKIHTHTHTRVQITIIIETYVREWCLLRSRTYVLYVLFTRRYRIIIVRNDAIAAASDLGGRQARVARADYIIPYVSSCTVVETFLWPTPRERLRFDPHNYFYCHSSRFSRCVERLTDLNSFTTPRWSDYGHCAKTDRGQSLIVNLLFFNHARCIVIN